jgi:hypothetical protein
MPNLLAEMSGVTAGPVVVMFRRDQYVASGADGCRIARRPRQTLQPA